MLDLEKELKESKDRLEYERNKYTKQLEGLKSGLINKVESMLAMELEGLDTLADGMGGIDSLVIKSYVNNIRQLLKTL